MSKKTFIGIIGLIGGLAACGGLDIDQGDFEYPPNSEEIAECNGHGTRFAGGGSCECDAGYDLNPNDITSCVLDAETCGGHGQTSIHYDLSWTCACDVGYEVDPNDPLNFEHATR